MRSIKFDKGKISKSDTDIPAGDAFFVDEKGSQAIISDVLYIDGKKAPSGKHTIKVGNKELPIDVGAKGKAQRGNIRSALNV